MNRWPFKVTLVFRSGGHPPRSRSDVHASELGSFGQRCSASIASVASSSNGTQAQHMRAESGATEELSINVTDKVSIPQTLFKAHEDGKLVFFVGAGESMGPPTKLPSFPELAKQLADLARVEVNPLQNVDQFLGSLPPSFNAHKQVKRILSKRGIRTNETHYWKSHVIKATFGILRKLKVNSLMEPGSLAREHHYERNFEDE